MATTPEDMNAATRLFNLPELLEMILLSMPRKDDQEKLEAMRMILTARTTTSTWHSLLEYSTPLRRILCLPAAPGFRAITAQSETCEISRWLRWLLDCQATQGVWYSSNDSNFIPSVSKIRVFSFILSRDRWAHMPATGNWRKTLASTQLKSCTNTA